MYTRKREAKVRGIKRNGEAGGMEMGRTFVFETCLGYMQVRDTHVSAHTWFATHG